MISFFSRVVSRLGRATLFATSTVARVYVIDHFPPFLCRPLSTRPSRDSYSGVAACPVAPPLRCALVGTAMLLAPVLRALIPSRSRLTCLPVEAGVMHGTLPKARRAASSGVACEHAHMRTRYATREALPGPLAPTQPRHPRARTCLACGVWRVRNPPPAPPSTTSRRVDDPRSTSAQRAIRGLVGCAPRPAGHPPRPPRIDLVTGDGGCRRNGPVTTSSSPVWNGRCAGTRGAACRRRRNGDGGGAGDGDGDGPAALPVRRITAYGVRSIPMQ